LPPVQPGRPPVQISVSPATKVDALKGWLDRLFNGAYPRARRSDQVDDYHGERVPDPYRWMEDPNSQETQEFVAAQNERSERFLSKGPMREAIRDRLTELFAYRRVTAPQKYGDFYLHRENSGLEDQAPLMIRPQGKLKARVLLDPKEFAADGTAALNSYAVSPDNAHLAYALSFKGSDWQEIRIRHIASGKDLPDVLRWSKFHQPSWSPDGKTIFYGRYEKPADDQLYTAPTSEGHLYAHVVGTPQEQDRIFMENSAGLSFSLSGDRWMLLQSGGDSLGRVFLQDRSGEGYFGRKMRKVAESGRIVGITDDWIYMITDADAPRRKLIAVGVKNRKERREIIPQGPDNSVLEDVALEEGKLIATWSVDVNHKLKVYDLDGKFERDVPLPGEGTAYVGGAVNGKVFVGYGSVDHPDTLFRFDPKTGEMKTFFRPKVPFDVSQIEVKQVFYQSKDGQTIPMTIAHKKGLAMDGANPTYLYGYGGFDVTMHRSFSAAQLAWMERGGVFAVANLRGGGEYGPVWHDAGRRQNKQNVFDDFAYAAKWLIEQRYTRPARLAIAGGSNGGLLVGATMLQNPALFGAAIPMVGVHDMLRFQHFTVGKGWAYDYGLSSDKDDYHFQRAYSPLHNVASGANLPATLVLTGDHDDRVVPSHSHKFTATLQAAQAGPAPILEITQEGAGHGAGKPLSKRLDEYVNIFTFLAKTLGFKW
jgi:prolyl oligopeptidase